MATKQISRAKKGAKKAFFEVKTPLTATKIQLYGSSIDELVGKIIRLDLTRSLKGKNFELRMKTIKSGEDLAAEPIKLWLIGSYIRRMMRLSIDYVEDSFDVELKDGKAKIKPFLITRNKVSRAVRKELRNSAKKFIGVYCKTRTSGEMFIDIMTNKLQKELFVKLKKIYPLSLCEIRIFELIAEKE